MTERDDWRDIEQLDLPETQGISLRVSGPLSNVDEAMARAMAWIRERGYTPAGPPVGIYVTPQGPSADDREVELFIPIVERDIEGEGDIRVRTMQGSHLRSTIHEGRYDESGISYEELYGYLGAQNIRASGPLEEEFRIDESETPPEDVLSELAAPTEGEDVMGPIEDEPSGEPPPQPPRGPRPPMYVPR